MTQLSTLQPSLLWNYFEAICTIPHPSKNEAKMIAFIEEFARKNNLKNAKDEVGNIVISKPATQGFENKKKVVFQSHLDMVPQKNNDTVHDFNTDPIQPYIDGEWVKAKGTTLGADNGIGVAAALAVLESNDLQHGPLEALFTIDEETGLTGAFALKPGFITGDILLNLDSEDEGELFIGCAGGVNLSGVFSYKTEPIPDNYKAFRITLKGLKGGHSGCDIHLGRGNANKLICRFLKSVSENVGLRLCSINGGTVRNAIPREVVADVVVPVANEEMLKSTIVEYFGRFKKEHSNDDPDIEFFGVPIANPSVCIDADSQQRVIDAVCALPNGAIKMISDMPDVVETSTNLAIIKTLPGTIEILCLLRSSDESAKMVLVESMENIFKRAGAHFNHEGSYPGWKPNIHSPILEIMKATYHKLYGASPLIKVIHAGLECGIIGDIYPGLDMVSFGPTIRNPHSPDEKVHIESVQKFWEYLLVVLQNVPEN